MLSAILGDNAVKKKKEKPQTNKKAAQGRDKRLVYSSALRNFGKYFFFFKPFFFLKSLFYL